MNKQSVKHRKIERGHRFNCVYCGNTHAIVNMYKSGKVQVYNCKGRNFTVGINGKFVSGFTLRITDKYEYTDACLWLKLNT